SKAVTDFWRFGGVGFEKKSTECHCVACALSLRRGGTDLRVTALVEVRVKTLADTWSGVSLS
ncbi:hypothetical protein BaRGS_00010271, partial [Batillaria attramentaria]